MLESRDFKIMTDSTTDLTPKLVEELDVHVIPMEFIFGDEVYHNYPDAREMTSEEFFTRLKNGEMPKTNQINTATFTETFEPYLEQGLDVLYIGFSSALSGTFMRAQEAIEELQKKYTPQILSRIAGEYQTLPFAGRDIRQIKKEREA